MKEIKLSSVLLKEADTPNLNGTIFSKKALESIHTQIQENKGRILGELGQDNSVGSGVNTAKAISIVEDSKFEDGKLFVDVIFREDKIPMEFLQPALRVTASPKDNVIEDDVKLIAVDWIIKP